MFGIDSGELLVIAVVALVVIGPKDLPRVMRTIGNFVGRARGMASHFRSGVDAMIRETELADMEKKWKADNEKIMREHPKAAPDDSWAEPTPALEAGADAQLPPPRPAKPKSNRPKPPPRRAAAARPVPAAPPIPAPAPEAPPAQDDGA